MVRGESKIWKPEHSEYCFEEQNELSDIVTNEHIVAYNQNWCSFQINEIYYDLVNTTRELYAFVIEHRKISKYLSNSTDNLHATSSEYQKSNIFFIQEGLKFLQIALNELVVSQDKNGFFSSNLKKPNNPFQLDYDERLQFSKVISKKTTLPNGNNRFICEAIKNFTNALKIYEADFISLYYIGYIYLKFVSPIEYGIVEKYFQESAFYFYANFMNERTNPSTSNRYLYIRGSFQLDTAQMYLYAGECCFHQGKFAEAIEFAEKAWEIFPEMVLAGFKLSKYLIVNNDVSKAKCYLKKVVLHSPNLWDEALEDADIKSNADILDYLDVLRMEAQNDLNADLEYCENIIVENSIVLDDILFINESTNRQSFREIKKAIYFVNRPRHLTIKEGAQIGSDGKFGAYFSKIECSGSLKEFIAIERKSFLGKRVVENNMKIRKLNNSKIHLQNNLPTLEGNGPIVPSDRKYEAFDMAVFTGLLIVEVYGIVLYAMYDSFGQFACVAIGVLIPLIAVISIIICRRKTGSKKQKAILAEKQKIANLVREIDSLEKIGLVLEAQVYVPI